jgi:hypothetical protein
MNILRVWTPPKLVDRKERRRKMRGERGKGGRKGGKGREGERRGERCLVWGGGGGVPLHPKPFRCRSLLMSERAQYNHIATCFHIIIIILLQLEWW